MRASRGCLVVAVALMMAGPAVAQEASSWSSSTIAPPNQRPGDIKLARPPATKTAPTASRILPQGKPVGGLTSFKPASESVTRGTGALATTTVEKKTPGTDPAYDAFEQGRFLTAHDLATKGAEAGEPQAATLLGRLYQEGLGVKQDLPLAARWYRRAAELGDVEGTFAFAVMLAEGEGIQKNRAGAAQLFDTAAQRGHALANYNLALLFLKGDGKPENPHRAAMHMRYAAEQGIAAAQFDLASLYATGTGVEPNAYHAATWLGRAADQGYADAEVEFGVWLFQGRGVQVSQTRGFQYFRSAAEKGLAVAQNRLARCYAHGAGVSKDVMEAAKWHLIARAGGVGDASLDDLLKGLKPNDRLTAESAADAWRDQTLLR